MAYLELFKFGNLWHTANISNLSVCIFKTLSPKSLSYPMAFYHHCMHIQAMHPAVD